MHRIRWNSDLYRTLVLTLLGALSVVVVALANRDVYPKDVVDQKIHDIERVEDRRHESLNRELDYLQEDVRWIVRQMGGTPSDEAREGDHSP